MKAMEVYGWQSFRRGAPGHGQTREIVAARSKTEVGRIVGRNPRQLFNLERTGNALELATALAEPGIVFWRDINARGDDPFTRDATGEQS